MKISVKERVYQALKSKNYFESGKKDSLEVFEKAEHLEDVIIQVERGCNVDKLFFHYNPITRKFHRVTFTDNDKKLLRREKSYRRNDICIKKKCFKKQIDVDSFIKLIECGFEPISVFSA